LDVTLLLLAGLLTVVSLIQPLAARLGIAASILLAVVGMAIGLAAAAALQADPASTVHGVAQAFNDLPVSSAVFIYVFLPLLLFQTALTISVQRILEDAAPILLLAVVAVLVETFVIGVALSWVAPASLLACLLLGSIVSTTDPVAVISIFRDVGAPSRLSRLLEGESLLNDAAAITMFTVLLALLLGHGAAVGTTIVTFLRNFAGGIVIGYLAARLVTALLSWLPDMRLAQVTLTLALPYIVFILGERQLAVSGVVATVVAGLSLNAIAQPKMAPADWQFLRDLWQQLDFWASSLIFILAALLVPRLMLDITWTDWLLLGVLVAASLSARALTLFGLIPLLSFARLSQRIDVRFKVVILWGGLRGAVTLALALAVTENPDVPPDVRRFIAVLATGFVLFTLLANGTTLRLLIRVLALDRLSAFDRALREQVLALSRDRVAEAVTATGEQYRFPRELTSAIAESYHREAAASPSITAGTPRDQLLLGVLALANRERELILEHFAAQTISGRVVEELLTDASRIVERTRARGAGEYLPAAQRTTAFSSRFRFALFLHRRFHLDGPLVDSVSDRFERLLVSRIVIGQLVPFIDEKLVPLLGSAVAAELTGLVAERRRMTDAALAALRVQHADYADVLERRFLKRVALRHQDQEHRTLFQEGVIGPELYNALQREVSSTRAAVDVRPPLDLGLDARALIARVPLFAKLSSSQLGAVARLLHPRFAVPGEQLIREGERGDSMYFISSGALEVHAAGRKIRLERGDFVGEMALLSGERRQADVQALTYCQLLVLHARDFRRLLASSRRIRARIDRVAEARRRENLAD
jgi:monovalent cation:H+ antiporter, CPA1 family